MTTLWQRMGAIFGNQWELNFGSVGCDTYRTWFDALKGYSEAQIGTGVNACREWDSGFVPHLGQFARLCLAKTTRGENFTEVRMAREAGLAQLTKQRPEDTAATRHEKQRIADMRRGIEPETKAESYHKLDLHIRWGALP